MPSEKSEAGQADPHQEAWNNLARLNRRGIGAFFLAIAVLVLAGIAAEIVAGYSRQVSDLIGMTGAFLFFACWIGVFGSYLCILLFKCPRCRKWFYGFPSGSYQLLFKTCRSCGLRKGEDKSGWSLWKDPRNAKKIAMFSILTVFTWVGLLILFVQPCERFSGFVSLTRAAYHERCECLGRVVVDNPTERDGDRARSCIGIVKRRWTETDTALEAQLLNPRRYEKLNPKDKAFVKEAYKQILIAKDAKDFASVIREADSILVLVDNFNDTKEYRALALKHLNPKTP